MFRAVFTPQKKRVNKYKTGQYCSRVPAPVVSKYIYLDFIYEGGNGGGGSGGGGGNDGDDVTQ